MSLGAFPDCLVGHSLGEYAAALLSGVLSLADAVRLVGVRAELMGRAGQNAAMMTVALGESELVRQIGPDLSLAAVNASDECVVSGATPALDALAERLEQAGVSVARIPLAAAAHSHLLDPVLDEFAAALRGVALSEPTLPYVSNLTGEWITSAQATDPSYWVAHLRGTVRFAAGLGVALASGDALTVESDRVKDSRHTRVAIPSGRSRRSRRSVTPTTQSTTPSTALVRWDGSGAPEHRSTWPH